MFENYQGQFSKVTWRRNTKKLNRYSCFILFLFLFSKFLGISFQTIMEEIISRFPIIGDYIFEELNGKDFCKAKEVSRTWNCFISNEIVLQRALEAHKAYKKRIQDEIIILTEECKRSRRFPRPTPFHLAAERGYLPVCQEIMENSDDKNPENIFGVTPLHKAAENGHLSVCQLIVVNVDDKNPKDNIGFTPLHKAAENGHMSVCQLIIENVDDKNPKNKNGWTPLHWAAENGHLSLCQLIVVNVDDKNPKTNRGWTPLHLAAHNGHLPVCQLIVENVDDKNPQKEDGVTPIDLAASNNHLEIKKLIENAIEIFSAGSNHGSKAMMGKLDSSWLKKVNILIKSKIWPMLFDS